MPGGPVVAPGRVGGSRAGPQVVEHRVQRHFQRLDLALDLGEQETAVQRRKRRQGKVVGVAVEFAAGMHGLQAGLDLGFPSQKPEAARRPN
jgi:hypothetical protein